MSRIITHIAIRNLHKTPKWDILLLASDKKLYYTEETFNTEQEVIQFAEQVKAGRRPMKIYFIEEYRIMVPGSTFKPKWQPVPERAGKLIA